MARSITPPVSGAANRTDPPGPSTYVRDFLLLYILWLGVVTVTPFSPVSQDLEAVETQTNLLRTGLLLAGFGLTLPLYFLRPLTKLRFTFSIPLMALFALTLLSSTWAIDQAVSIRRSVAMVIYSMFILCAMAQVPVNRALRIIAAFLAVVIFIDLASVLVIPEAVHPMSELDAALRGNWRGMHNHKNIAASVAAFSVFMSLYQWRTGGAASRIFYTLALIAALAFLIGTRSKTSLAMTIFGALCYFINSSSFGKFRNTDRVMLFSFVLAVVFVIILLAIPQFQSLLEDPRALTGRSEIWSILIDYSLKHPLSGSGFGSFWQIGYKSPAMAYTRDWAGVSAPHGHNGYLDAAAAIGFPGLFLVLVAFVIIPLWRVVVLPMNPELRALTVTLLIFTIIYNMFESSYMNTRDLVWTLFMFGYAIILRMQSNIERGI